MSETTGPRAHERPVFIIATARSGTTLLQRYLNLSPNLAIWGEHAGFVIPLQQSYQRLVNDASMEKFLAYPAAVREDVIAGRPVVSDQKWTIEWLNPFNRQDVRASYRTFLIALFAQSLPDHVRWGFKEVQYGLEQARFLAEVFPAARFLLPLRRPFDVILSKARAFAGAKCDDEQLRVYVRQNRRFLDLVAALDNEPGLAAMPLLLDDLQSAPVETMAQVSDFVEIEPLCTEKIEALASARYAWGAQDALADDLARRLENDAGYHEVVRLYDACVASVKRAAG